MAAKRSSVKIDTTAGSRSYNRLDIQVSQSLHMAIELYDDLNYLLILDHYDDITIFDMDADPLVVSYYQMKTSDTTITIDSAIKEDWLAKLHTQLSRPEDWVVKELGLITNTPLEISYTTNSNGSAGRVKQNLYAEHTSFTNLNQLVVDKIRKDISDKCTIPIDQVDLSKFAHLRTTLSIDRHRDIVKSEISEFLNSKYPHITFDTIKGIYSTLIEILTQKQQYERLPDNSTLDAVQKYKGFSNNDFTRIIDKASMISIPSFDDVTRYAHADDDLKYKIALPYAQILTDTCKQGDQSFIKIFNTTLEVMEKIPIIANENVYEYGQKIGNIIQQDNPSLCIIYNVDYIAVLTICLLINKSRSSQ